MTGSGVRRGMKPDLTSHRAFDRCRHLPLGTRLLEWATSRRPIFDCAACRCGRRRGGSPAPQGRTPLPGWRCRRAAGLHRPPPAAQWRGGGRGGGCRRGRRVGGYRRIGAPPPGPRRRRRHTAALTGTPLHPSPSATDAAAERPRPPLPRTHAREPPPWHTWQPRRRARAHAKPRRIDSSRYRQPVPPPSTAIAAAARHPPTAARARPAVLPTPWCFFWTFGEISLFPSWLLGLGHVRWSSFCDRRGIIPGRTESRRMQRPGEREGDEWLDKHNSGQTGLDRDSEWILAQYATKLDALVSGTA